MGGAELRNNSIMHAGIYITVSTIHLDGGQSENETEGSEAHRTSLCFLVSLFLT